VGKARDWFNGLSETGKIGLIGAVITTVGGGLFGVIIALIPVLADGRDSESEVKPSALASETLGSSEVPPTPTPPAKSTPTDSASAAPVSYKLVYENRAMSLGMSSEHRSTIDFDAPSARRYSYDEWDELTANAQETGIPIEADLSYHDAYYGPLMLSDGRSAAQLSAEKAPDTAQECARDGRVGGFSETNMTEWKVPEKTVFCVVTDEGNVVRAQIERLVGTPKPGAEVTVNNAPEQIEFNVTMWEPA
jgi:hypothetical protein